MPVVSSMANIKTTIYPSCWVELQLRVEDFKARKAFVPDVAAVPGMDPIAQAAYFDIEHIILPMSCTVSLRSYREGDEAKISIPLSSLPIDPRIIRQGTVKIYMGLMTPTDYGESQGPIGGNAKIQLIPKYGPDIDPLTGQMRSNEIFRGFFDNVESVYDEGGDVMSISCRDITALFIDEEVPIQALKDIPADVPLDQVIQMIISGEPTARSVPPDDKYKRSGKVDARRDARRLKHQITILTNRLVKATTAGDTAEIQRINGKILAASNALIIAQAAASKADADISLAPRYGMQSARDVRVVNETGAPLPTLSSIKGASWFDSKRGAVRVSKRGSSNEKISYWDLITDIVVGCGFICYVRTNAGVAEIENPTAEIVINHPRTYYAEGPVEIRKFIYGYNVDNLTLSRNYGGRGRPAAIVYSAVNDLTGEVISARYPPLPLNAKGGIDKTKAKDVDEAEVFISQDRIGVSPTGQSPEEQLKRMAHSLFEQRGRAEMEIDIETTIQSALPSNASETFADILALRPADTIEVELLPPDTIDSNNTFVTPAGAFMSLPASEKTARLIQIYKFNPLLAAEIAAAYDNPFLQRFFRVKEVTVDFDAESGFNFNIKSINNLDARNTQLVIDPLGWTPPPTAF